MAETDDKDYPLEIEAGTYFAKTFLIRRKDIDGNPTVIVPLTGIAYAQVRTAPGARLLVDFECTVDGPNGSITIAAPREATRHRGSGVWELRLVDGTNEQVKLRGPVTFQPQVAVIP